MIFVFIILIVIRFVVSFPSIFFQCEALIAKFVYILMRMIRALFFEEVLESLSSLFALIMATIVLIDPLFLPINPSCSLCFGFLSLLCLFEELVSETITKVDGYISVGYDDYGGANLLESSVEILHTFSVLLVAILEIMVVSRPRPCTLEVLGEALR